VRRKKGRARRVAGAAYSCRPGEGKLRSESRGIPFPVLRDALVGRASPFFWGGPIGGRLSSGEAGLRAEWRGGNSGAACHRHRHRVGSAWRVGQRRQPAPRWFPSRTLAGNLAPESGPGPRFEERAARKKIVEGNTRSPPRTGGRRKKRIGRLPKLHRLRPLDGDKGRNQAGRRGRCRSWGFTIPRAGPQSAVGVRLSPTQNSGTTVSPGRGKSP